MKLKIMKWASGMLLLTFSLSGVVFADDAELLSLVKGLQSQMKDMQKTINKQNDQIRELQTREPQVQIASGNGEAPVAAPMSDYEFNQRLDAATGGAQKWLKDLKFAGDVRLRYEAFHYGSGNPNETDDRNRFRYRLRFGWEKKFSDDIKIGFGLASGETGTAGTNGLNVDPTSTNSTLDNNFNFKQINIEKVYATYTPGFAAKRGILDKTEITAGKFNNPFEKGSSDMIWDRDVKPEGVFEKVDLKLLDTPDFGINGYATAGQFVLDEDSALGGDSNLYAFQFGVNPVIYTPLFDKPVDVLQAFSLYTYDNYADNSNFIIGGTSLARGNINIDGVATELDAGRFQVLEYYSELAVYPWNIPTRFHIDLAMNPADKANGNSVVNENQAFGGGVKLGGIVKKGDWEIGYQYKRIEANSVVGAFTDSDFGDGHIGKQGSVVKAGYALTDNLTLNSAMFFVDNLNHGTAGIIDQQQRRFQLDLVWKF